MVTCLGRSGRGASQVEKSPRLNWATQFLTVAYDGACSPKVSVTMAWISVGVLPCRKKKPWWQLASPCCLNRARRLTCFLSTSVTRKKLAIRHMNRPLSNDTIDSVLQHREVGWAKDLSAPLVNSPMLRIPDTAKYRKRNEITRSVFSVAVKI